VEMRVINTEMSLKGAHTMIALTKEDVSRVWMEINSMNDSLANYSNQLEVVRQEDVAWCCSRITALEKPNNPANHSLWRLVNALSTRLDRQEDEIKDLKSGLVRAHEKIGNLEMSSSLVRGRVSTLEDVMEAAPTPTDLMSDEEYADVDDGEDDAWYIPPIMRRRIHALDEYTTAAVEPVPEYVEDRREDPSAGPHRDDLPADGLGDELWANLGVNLRDRRAE
jgi:hypothetical protein